MHFGVLYFRVSLKPITTSASRDHSCFASKLSDGKRENYREREKKEKEKPRERELSSEA